MKTTSTLLRFLALAGSSILAVSSASAADVTWDITPGTVGVGNGTVTGGTGTWNTSLAAVPNGNWTTDAGANNIAWNNSGDDTAVFGGTAGTVTLDNNVTVGGLTFNTNNYIIAPGTGPFNITFGAPGNINVSTGTSRIDAAVGGSAINKTGGGELTFSVANTFNGLSLNGGTVSVNGATDSLGAAGSAITVLGNTTLKQGGTGAISLNKSLNVSSGTLTFVHGNAGWTIQGAVSGSGGIKVNDAGTDDTRTLQLINTANTFTGAIDLTNNRATVKVASLGDSVGAGNILFGGNTSMFYLGTEAVAPMTLTHRAFEFQGGATTATIQNRNTASSHANTLTINSALSVTTTGAKILVLGGANIGNNAFNGAIADGSGTVSLTKADAGTWILGGSNSYTSGTSITGGTLIARSGTALGTGTGANVTVATQTGLHYNAATDTALQIGGTLGITGGTSTNIGASIGSTTTSARINVAGNATTTAAGVRVNIYGNSFSATTGGTGAYTLLQGGGTNTLNNATYTLGTVFNATNFTVGAINKSTDAVTVDITAATALTSVYWKGTATAGITQVWAASNGSNTSNWTNTDGGTIQSLVPGSNADVFITGTSLTTNPTNTRLGADMSIKSLTISNALGLNGDGSKLTIGTGGITMDNGVGSSAIGANVTLGSNQTWTNNSTNALTVSGVVSGSSTLNKAGTGTVTLTGTNTYTGATTVSNGTLIVNGNISTSMLTTVQTGATLGGSGTVGALTINSGGFLAPGNSPGATTVNGAYTQNGTLISEITGLIPGTQHDQVIVNGTVTLNGLLNLTTFSGSYVANDLIFILLNDSNDAISGTFTGLADGSVASTYGGFNWNISYFGNQTAPGVGTFAGGNDIVLQATVIPEPATALLGCLGLLMILRRRR